MELQATRFLMKAWHGLKMEGRVIDPAAKLWTLPFTHPERSIQAIIRPI